MKQQQKDINNSKTLLPRAEEIERTVLSTLLNDAIAMDLVSDILRQDLFYNQNYAIIFQAMNTIHLSARKIDMMSVINQLMKDGHLEEIGGPVAISDLSVSSFSAHYSNIREHALYLHQLYIARKIIITGETLISKANLSPSEVDSITDWGIREMENVMSDMCFEDRSVDIVRASAVAVDRYMQRQDAARKGSIVGVPTGLRKLDKITGGFKPAQVIILAARPAMGKTALMLHFAMCAAKGGFPAVIFSLEMSADDLVDRMMVSAGDLDAERFQQGYLRDEERPVLMQASGALSYLPITIDDTPKITMQQISSRCRNLQRKGRCGIVFIDYLQLVDMRIPGTKYTREQEVTACSRDAKVLAKELNVPVVVLSQLNRNSEIRADKIPLLSDLRESGAIEQDADIILFPHRPEYYDPNESPGVGVLRVAKHRNGRTGDMKFRYNKTVSRFDDNIDSNIPIDQVPF